MGVLRFAVGHFVLGRFTVVIVGRLGIVRSARRVDLNTSFCKGGRQADAAPHDSGEAGEQSETEGADCVAISGRHYNNKNSS